MPSIADQLVLQIYVQPEQWVSPTEFDALTRALLTEIQNDVEIDSIALKSDEAPPGTRSAPAVTLGLIAVALLPVVVGKLVDLLISWLGRNPGKKLVINVPAGKANVTIEYNPDKSSRDEIQRLVSEAVGIAKAKYK